MKRIYLLALLFLSGGAIAGVTYTQAGWELTSALGNQNAASYAACVTLLKAQPLPARKRTDYCREKWITTVTPDVPPPLTCTTPKPADETRSQACPAGTTGSWSQTRTYSAAAYPTCWTAGEWAPSAAPAGACTPVVVPPDPPVPPTTAAAFTDLASAPACVTKVREYLWIGGALDVRVVDRAATAIPFHTGRCLEATPATFTAAFWAAVQPGDVVTLRAGTYSQRWGEGTWYFANGETYKKGTAAQPIAVVAAPGEKVVMQAASRPPVVFGNGSQSPKQWAEYLTFAGIDYIGTEACVSGGGDSTDPSGGPSETGGRYIRIVGGSCTITDATSNTMTGLIDLGNDGWKILGMTFRDPANRTVINNNHGVYVQGGADDVEVAYNDFQLHTGHVIQNHQDGTPKLYERLSFHDNYLHGVNWDDMRGISVINVADASTVTIARNKFRHTGQAGWGCINIYRGQVTVADNDCQDAQGGLNLNGQYGGTRQVTATGNLICPVNGWPRIGIEGGATASQIVESGAKACP